MDQSNKHKKLFRKLTKLTDEDTELFGIFGSYHKINFGSGMNEKRFKLKRSGRLLMLGKLLKHLLKRLKD